MESSNSEGPTSGRQNETRPDRADALVARPGSTAAVFLSPVFRDVNRILKNYWWWQYLINVTEW